MMPKRTWFKGIGIFVVFFVGTLLYAAFTLLNSPEEKSFQPSQSQKEEFIAELPVGEFDNLQESNEEDKDKRPLSPGCLQNKTIIFASIENLKNPDWEIRAGAAELLGETDCREIEIVLIAVLGDDHYYVRQKAAEALGKLGSIKAVPHLIKSIHDTEGDVTRYSLSSLGSIRDNRAVDPLIEVLDNFLPNDHLVREEVKTDQRSGQGMEAQEKSGKKTRFTIDERLNAAYSLGRIGRRDAIPAFIRNLKDSSWRMRVTCALLLGLFKATEALPALESLLTDPNEIVRGTAAWAIMHITNDPQDIPQTRSFMDILKANGIVPLIQ